MRSSRVRCNPGVPGRAGPAVVALAAVVPLIVHPVAAVAQDSQWWTNQYGNRARLLGGAVVGSSRDLSAVYYNPGGLGLVEEPEALLTGFVFELDNLTYRGLLLEDTKVSSTSFDLVAGLIAGQIRFGFLGDSKLAYSYLTRHNLDYQFNEGGATEGETIPGAPAVESAAGSLTLETKLRESWGGLTWSKPLGRLGLGISTFVANRSQRGRFGGSLLSVEEIGGVQTISSQDRYDYYSWRMLWKIGLATSFSRWNAGLTITTPSLNLLGNGNVQSESIGLLPGLQEVAITYQDDLPARYSSSWALAAGFEYIGDGWRGHAAVEWFDRIDITVLDAAPYRAQTDTTLVLSADVRNVMKGVANLALGFEKDWTEELSGYATAYTDFTGKEAGDRSITTTTPWNLWTVGAGAIFSVGRSEFTLGLTYKFGSQDDIEQLDLIPGSDLDDELLQSDVTGSFWRLTLVLGFNLEFGPKI